MNAVVCDGPKCEPVIIETGASRPYPPDWHRMMLWVQAGATEKHFHSCECFKDWVMEHA